MKKIKFRAWDKKENKMYYVPCIWFSLHVADLGMGEKNHQLGYDHIELMQYTGLKDKNAPCKDVYEYDIIDKYGKVIGNRYETPTLLKDPTNYLVEELGGEKWADTVKRLVREK